MTATLIGMIHVGALPGTPAAARPLDDLINQAVTEATVYADAGLATVIIENMHDAPYLNRRVGPEIVASMTAVGRAIRTACPDLTLGVQILAGANRAALAVALACGARFIRAENFCYAHVADEGLMPTASAGPLLRYRRRIGADHIQVFADLKKKHASHALTADTDLAETARTAAFFRADGLIVTGPRTGAPTSLADLQAVKAATDLPVWVGSGVTPETAPTLAKLADALIVGSACKHDHDWTQPVDPTRVQALVTAIKDA